MAITVIVRHGDGGDTRLTFDANQRIVIGRGAGSDVRLPDPSVSHRHASLRAQGTEFFVVDEASTNGTYVGSVRIAPHTSRLVRSGDKVRLGRVWLELQLDQAPVTRDVAAATRDLALALVSQAMAAIGADRSPQVRVVEGPDRGTVLVVAQEDRAYVVGRAPHCDLALTDGDCSREHLHVLVRLGAVFIRDQETKNGTFIGEVRAPRHRDVPWRSANMVRIGRTVLELHDPLRHALAQIEHAADEEIDNPDARLQIDDVAPPQHASPAEGESLAQSPPPSLKSAPPAAVARSKGRGRWSLVDMAVMAAAVGVLVLSLAGLVWLLRG